MLSLNDHVIAQTSGAPADDRTADRTRRVELLGAPILLGLWVTPSVAGFWLSLAVLAAFLTRQPLKLMLGDWRRGKRFPRTIWAERFALLYGLIALGAFAAAWFSAVGCGAVLLRHPKKLSETVFLLVSHPRLRVPRVWQLFSDSWVPAQAGTTYGGSAPLFRQALKQSCALVAERCGATAISAGAAVIAQAYGWPMLLLGLPFCAALLGLAMMSSVIFLQVFG